MNLADKTLARWRERRRSRSGPDLADMGTAFGLDASFADDGDAPLAAGAAAGAPIGARAVDPNAARPASPAGRWWHRRP